VTTLRVAFLAAVLVQACFPANLAVSTYFKDGFKPTAIASDAQGGRNLSLLSALTIAALSAQSTDEPEWQRGAGANLTFDVMPAVAPLAPSPG
jgi:hypothetical protein